MKWATVSPACLLLLLPAAGLAAQSAGPQAGHRTGGVSLGLQFAWDQAREDLLVPLRWSGPGVGLRLGWSRSNGSGRHDLELLLPFSFYHNRYGHAGYALGVEADYAYVRPLSGPGRPGTFAVGGRIGWDLYDGFYQSWDEEHAYWLSSLSLGPRLAWSGALGGDARVTLDVPLVAGVARPPRYRLNKADPLVRPGFHLVDMQKGMKLTSAPHFFALRAGVSLPFRRGSSFLLAWDFALATYDEPERVITMSHRLTVSHAFGR